MSKARWLYFLLCVGFVFSFNSTSYAQCEAYLLAALDEDNIALPGQRFDVSVWTGSPYCPASGQITIQTMPPGSAMIEGETYWVDSFFDVFTEVETVKPPIVPTVPPGMPFQIRTEVTFDDPAYPPLVYVEQVMRNMMGRLEIVHNTPCMDDVPMSLMPGQSSCFTVCHRIYTIPLAVPTEMGKPIIRVTPGCTVPPCGPQPCAPGDMNSYRYEVYKFGAQWYLEFEYSNPMMEPVCYCVTYEGNLPLGGDTFTLGGWENERQNMNVSVWTNNMAYPLNGTIEVFSSPSGAQIGGGGGGGGYAVDSFFDVFLEAWTFDPPIGPGAFTPGQQFQLIGYIHFDPPGPVYPPQWVVEDVVVTPSGGLELINPTCTGPVIVPPQITPGIPECLTVCHDIYHIPLICDETSNPIVTIHSGCDMTTPCGSPLSCTPGAMSDFRYDVYRVGGSWILEFEYSNELIQPVCYCVDVSCPATPRPVTYALGALNEMHQTFSASVWGSSPQVPLNGTIHYRSEPPGAVFGWHVDSFFDVFMEPFTAEVPVLPGAFLPGETFQIIAEFDFSLGSAPFEGQVYTENVVVTPGGGLALWDPITPCGGDFVPPDMSAGQSECFRVCHRIYEIPLYYSEIDGRPNISVTPGCQGLPFDNCTMQACTPGGPNDFVYDVYYNGMNWMLRFEYSNPYIEPVCYCVTYTGNVPYDCETRQLAALDEGHMGFDVSVRTYSPTGATCPAAGTISLYSYPPGAYFGPYPDSFFDVFTEWYSIEAPVGPGEFGPGAEFQLIAYIDYTAPEYPDQWLTEEVIVEPSGQYLWINDTGGECTGDVVPIAMNVGIPECFKVCHRIYHIPITNAIDPANPPTITVTPGCIGEPQDHCTPDPTCTPGHPDYYRADLLWTSGHWELEFEYSNENVEPVCYCVTAEGAASPCETHELIALDEYNQILKLSLAANPAPGGTDPCLVDGIVSYRSFPPGAYIGPHIDSFFDIFTDWTVLTVPVGPGLFMPGQVFELTASIEYTDPDLPDLSVSETVMVSPDDGLRIFDGGGECSSGITQVPVSMNLGQAECFVVCHDIYYIPLVTPGPGTPVITVTPGCEPPCVAPGFCTPGGPYDFRYDVVKVGGTWMLEFEYSNPNNEPACYCVQFFDFIAEPKEAFVLASLDEEWQVLDVTLWTSDCSCQYPASGQITVRKWEGDPDTWVTSFFDIFCELPPTRESPGHFTIPVAAGSFLPGENFQFEIDVDFFGPGSDPFDGVIYYEDAIVRPDGMIAPYYPYDPCFGVSVPPMMTAGQSACFTVCHDIYDISLDAPPGVGQPVIRIVPGCEPPCVNPGCTPGGPQDYCYWFWHDGANWHLMFEYSNPYIEPVCYCVTYIGNTENAHLHELMSLDDQFQTLDLTLWTTGATLSLTAIIDICSVPEGAFIGPYVPFMAINPEWNTIQTPVGAGSFTPGQAFQFVTHIDYPDPYEDHWVVDDVIVGPAGELHLLDTGGECTGDNVPTSMLPDAHYCFEVCHRIYHIPLNSTDPTAYLTLDVSPGCFGPEIDHCEPETCTPGGEQDYRYTFYWDGMQWVLEFEYSNKNIEPVCYCITYWENTAPPSVTDLSLHYEVEDIAVPLMHFYWTAPEDGTYIIYATPNPNHHSDPPGPDWTEIHNGWYAAGDAHWFTTLDETSDADYRNYIIVYTP